MGFIRVVALVTQDGGLVSELCKSGVPLLQMSEGCWCLKLIGIGVFPVLKLFQ